MRRNIPLEISQTLLGVAGISTSYQYLDRIPNNRLLIVAIIVVFSMRRC